MNASVELAGVRKRFRGAVALDDVSLQLEPGVTGLPGPNGAGKTTLPRIVATALGQDDGAVRVLGFDPGQLADRLEIRRRPGYLPQDSNVYSGFTAFAFVDYVAVVKEMTDRRRPHEEVRRVLEAVGLGDRAHQRIRALSGGMRRRRRDRVDADPVTPSWGIVLMASVPAVAWPAVLSAVGTALAVTATLGVLPPIGDGVVPSSPSRSWRVVWRRRPRTGRRV